MLINGCLYFGDYTKRLISWGTWHELILSEEGRRRSASIHRISISNHRELLTPEERVLFCDRASNTRREWGFDGRLKT